MQIVYIVALSEHVLKRQRKATQKQKNCVCNLHFLIESFLMFVTGFQHVLGSKRYWRFESKMPALPYIRGFKTLLSSSDVLWAQEPGLLWSSDRG